MPIYGYARCSTNETKQDIDRQRRELLAAGVPAKNIYFEYESGAKANRVEFTRLLHLLTAGDTLISTEVSRITRSTRQLCSLIEEIQQRKLQLNILGSISIDCRNGEAMDPMTKAFLQMAGVFAELERDMISARVRSGMENARAKGKAIGRPSSTHESAPSSFYRYYPQYRAGHIKIAEFARLAKLSRNTIYKYIKLVEEKE